MHKVRFKNTIDGDGNWDGTTLPPDDFKPNWQFEGGFETAALPLRVGRLKASLFGKAPGLDPYLLLATMWTSRDVIAGDLVGVDTNAPARNRDRWSAFPGNTHVSLVRPDDTITFFQNTNNNAWLELMIEPLAATNEFGEVLLNYAREAARERLEVSGVQLDQVVSSSTVLAPWAGTLRVRSTAGAGIILTLPEASGQQLRDLLIVERDGVGSVQLQAAAGNLINGQAAIAMTANNTSIFVRGSGARFNAAGVL